jgi:hypothetical protein
MTNSSGPNSPPSRGYAPLLDRLLPLYPSLAVQDIGSVREGYRRVIRIAHGWFMRIQRGVEAVLLLDGEGYAEEAAGIRRSVLEHRVALRWLVVEGDRINDTVARGHAEGARKRGQAAQDADWRSIDQEQIADVIAGVKADERDRSNDHLLHFMPRAQKYADAHTIPTYLAEVERVHPTYESAMAYVMVPTGPLLLTPREPVWQVPWATSSLLEGLLLIRQLWVEQPWEDELTYIVAEYRTVTNAVRLQDGLPSIEWP